MARPKPERRRGGGQIGLGGLPYSADLLRIDPKTIRQGAAHASIFTSSPKQLPAADACGEDPATAIRAI